MTILFYLSIFGFMVLCLVLCLVILIQESKSLGLGASFGGDIGESVFGTSTAEVLKKITAGLVVAFMICCIFLSFWSESITDKSVQKLPITIEDIQP